MTRYGDPQGLAATVKENLLDLLPITFEAVAVPVSTYSLKDVEQIAGYKRQLPDYGGDWSIATYIQAAATDDEAERDRLMSQILDYNREDLEATWEVLEWLRRIAENPNS